MEEHHSHIVKDYEFVDSTGFTKEKKMIALGLSIIATVAIFFYILSANYIETNWYFLIFVAILYIISLILLFIPEKVHNI